MSTSSTFEAALDQLLAEAKWGPAIEDGLGLKITASAAGGNVVVTTTHPELNRLGASVPLNRLQGWYIWATVNDQERSITTLSVSGGTATITGSGTNFTATSSTTFYILRFSIDFIRDLFNDGLNDMTVECMLPLMHGPTDGDLQDSDTVDASWTESNATDVPQTTAAEVWIGARSLVVTDSGSGGGYAESGNIRVGRGKRSTMHAIGKSDEGTSALRAVGGVSGTLETVSFTQEDWLYIKKDVTAGSSDEGITLRLLESTASAAGDWQFAWIVKHDSYVFRLPSWADARFRIKAISYAEFLASGDEADTWLADSVQFKRLREWEEYEYVSHEAAANPHMVILKPYQDMTRPYFVHIECPWSAPYGVSALLTTIATATLCPLNLLIPYAKKLLGKRGGQQFAEIGADGASTYDKRRQAHLTQKTKREVTVRAIF